MLVVVISILWMWLHQQNSLVLLVLKCSDLHEWMRWDSPKSFDVAITIFLLLSFPAFLSWLAYLRNIHFRLWNVLLSLSSPEVGNKLDCEPHEVTDETVDLFIEQFPKFNGYFKISCRTNQGVDEMINEIVSSLSSSNYSFKETFDAFTLHGQHTQGSCCSKDGGIGHSHEDHDSSNSGGMGSCCAK
jgi:hypothetical protein